MYEKNPECMVMISTNLFSNIVKFMAPGSRVRAVGEGGLDNMVI